MQSIPSPRLSVHISFFCDIVKRRTFRIMYWVDFKLFEFEVLLPSIHWRILTPFSCWQLVTSTICRTVTVSTSIGITLDQYVSFPKRSTVIFMTPNSRLVSAGNRVFGALIHTEQERVGRGLRDDLIGFRFPFSCCEAAKYEILGGLNYSQRPLLHVAESMEILCIPTIRGSIINPLNYSLRIMILNELEDHLPMGGGTKCLGTPKIFWGFVLQIRDGQNLLRDRYLG